MDHHSYVPVLKWKMGEYQALARLSEEAKSLTVPLLELTPPGFDFETNELRKSHAEHLKDFGKRLKSKWQTRPCFVDLHYLGSETQIGSKHCIDFVFDQAADSGAIPVISIQCGAACLAAVSRIASITERGLCLRFSGADYDDEGIADKLAHIGETTGVGWGKTDVVLDMCSPAYTPKSAFRASVAAMMATVPSLRKARSLIIVGTSFPRSLAIYKDAEQMIPRHEWNAYKDFVNSQHENARIPTFGDYGTAHPDLVELDMRFVTPFAKLKYTLEDEWYFAKGKAVRPEGFGQYRDMCKVLTKKHFFDGPDFSEADAYIANCAKGKAKTGNLSTWVWVATNRHIEKTVADLASFHAL